MNELETIASEAVAPDVKALQGAIRLLARNQGEIRDRQEVANELRQCYWEGQSADGRKHAEDLGEEAHPFEGATDSRVRMADTVIRERKALLLEAVMKSMPLVGAVESGDAELASRITSLVKWLRDSKLRPMLWREVQLAAEYFCADDPAVCVLGVFWEQRAALAWRAITLEEVVAYYAERAGLTGSEGDVGGLGQGTGDRGQDPTRAGAEMTEAAAAVEVMLALGNEGAAEAFLAGWLPGARADGLPRAVKDLRETGKARVAERYLRVNQPRWISYRLYEDIFLPIDDCDMERMPYVFVREWLTRTEVEGRALAEGWREGFEEGVLAAVGQTLVPEVAGGRLRARIRGRDGLAGFGQGTSEGAGGEAEERFEVWECYTRAADAGGVEGIWRTVIGAGPTSLRDGASKGEPAYGKHELLDYAHGELPFVLLQAEMMSRSLLDSRGVPALVGTHQTEVKMQRDTRGDHAMLSTLPPVKVHMRRGGLKLTVGPMAQIPVMRPDDIEKLDLGSSYPNTSIEMENAVVGEVNELLARRHPEADAARVAREEAMTVALFMEGIRAAWVQTIQLCQQYLDEVEIARVTGGRNVWMRLTREEIQGQFDLSFYLDVRDSNMEFLKMKIEWFLRMSEMDSQGVIDKSQLIQFGARAVDPGLADQVVQDPQTASVREKNEEQQAVLLMANGVEPEFVRQGSNAQLRLQVLQETIQKSPMLAERVQNADEKDPFRALVENRVKNLTFQLEQQANKETGRVGAKKMQG